MKSTLLVGIVVSSFLFLNGCSNEGSSSSLDGYNGRFIDSPVDGVDFECGSVTGKTKDGGIFGTCPYGSSVTFKLGNLVLATASQEQVERRNYNIFIKDIVTNEDDAVKSALLLLSLDTDPNDDIITIPDEATISEVLKELDLDSASNLSSVDIQILEQDIAKLASEKPEIVQDVAIDVAKSHLDITEESIPELPPVPQPGEQTGGE
jgi:hypothetical protein